MTAPPTQLFSTAPRPTPGAWSTAPKSPAATSAWPRSASYATSSARAAPTSPTSSTRPRATARAASTSCCRIKGEWAKPEYIDGKFHYAKIRLEDWQVFIEFQLFGWVHQVTRLRRFRRARLRKIARKNAKSTRLAGRQLYLGFADGEPVPTATAPPPPASRRARSSTSAATWPCASPSSCSASASKSASTTSPAPAPPAATNRSTPKAPRSTA